MNFEDLKAIRQKNGRERFGFYFAEGEHLVLELGRALGWRPELASARLFVSHEYLAAGLPAAFPMGLARETLSARQISQLSETRSPQGVIGLVPILPPPPPAPAERAIYLHQIQDPGNLGTILRTLAWFGGFRCLLSPDSVDPYNAKVVRASMGAIFSVPFETEVTLAEVRRRYPKSALLDPRGQSIGCDEFKKFDCYMFGNEAQGVSNEMTEQVGDAIFAISGSRKVESLNLAATVNICVYEIMRVRT